MDGGFYLPNQLNALNHRLVMVFFLVVKAAGQGWLIYGQQDVSWLLLKMNPDINIIVTRCRVIRQCTCLSK